MNQIHKYPRTPHLRGSRLQPGDEDMPQFPFSALDGKLVAVEEKVDGSNSGISCDSDGRLLLQSRGHYLTGGPGEWQFDLFKGWAHGHAHEFRAVLGDRYVIYGEWVYVKHTIFYNRLPAYFLEFDILDREEDVFLDTPSRRKLLAKLPFVTSVETVFRGKLKDKKMLMKLAGASGYIDGENKKELREMVLASGQDWEQIEHETDLGGQMEGLYIKVEEDGKVVDRYKWVRKSFHQIVEKSGSHWQTRKKIINLGK